ncbi:hypothetical protein FKM82_007120 [Ascaphus truei]
MCSLHPSCCKCSRPDRFGMYPAPYGKTGTTLYFWLVRRSMYNHSCYMRKQNIFITSPWRYTRSTVGLI